MAEKYDCGGIEGFEMMRKSDVSGYDEEPDNSKQGTGVKATKAQGERWGAPGDKTMESDEHLFRGLTRGTEAPMPSVNQYGIGSESEGARDVMRIQSEGQGPGEGLMKKAVPALTRDGMAQRSLSGDRSKMDERI